MLTWGDGVADVDLRRAADLSSCAREAGDVDRGAADRALRAS